MKTLFKNTVHSDRESHACLICEIKGKKVKMVYEAQNAFERCSISVFDGFEFKHILCMLDMGVKPDKSMYILSESKREAREKELFKIAEKMCNGIL